VTDRRKERVRRVLSKRPPAPVARPRYRPELADVDAFADLLLELLDARRRSGAASKP